MPKVEYICTDTLKIIINCVTAVIRGFINVFSGRETGFHISAKFLKELDGQIRRAKSSAQLVNFSGAQLLTKCLRVILLNNVC